MIFSELVNLQTTKGRRQKYAARPVRRQKSLVSPGRNPIEVRRLTKKDM